MGIRLLLALTGINAAMLIVTLTQPRPSAAQGVAPVVRARAFELVDERGHTRASISVIPADPAVKMPDGTVGYPEVVLLRLINSKGKPTVKIESADRGAVLYLGGETDPTNALIRSDATSTSLTLTNKDGRQRVLKP
ncbi:MAG TPA: hypothetical protein VGM23_02840, partial [Armatimonadota bacterium]|jgi:hypothetical protein